MKKFVSLASLAFFFIISFGSSSLFAKTWGDGCYPLYNVTGDKVSNESQPPTTVEFVTFLNQDNEATRFNGSFGGCYKNAYFEESFMRAPEFFYPSHNYCILRSLVPGCGLNPHEVSHYEYSVKPGCENDLILSVSLPKVQEKFLQWREQQENEDTLLPQT